MARAAPRSVPRGAAALFGAAALEVGSDPWLPAPLLTELAVSRDAFRRAGEPITRLCAVDTSFCWNTNAQNAVMHGAINLRRRP